MPLPSSPVCVLDASLVLAWCFEDEASDAADQLLQQSSVQGVAVPLQWHLEVAQLLDRAQRRERLTEARATEFLALLDAIPVETDAAPAERGRREVLYLARETRLSPYDAAYLDLAMRRRLPLATRDPMLRQAAAALGVTLLDL
ncbi:type II toxin-antitoxin system VapC family toxin [Aquabacterium sp. A7-Y]|uniref:type II toxin-antitoxin system VapC family toxin n=1 Tax=Aquabacterium sp. A7-Y TaxID=1349605 RepID=UPI00223D4394|nr:type II toxin-antitoxin system VapC family toxin [Aquabacterium sp. A7-Y]MCW7538379.1 type II toxin-antitoxin system VapC family toxin [Aquabacterium sp. A7-Y]